MTTTADEFFDPSDFDDAVLVIPDDARTPSAPQAAVAGPDEPPASPSSVEPPAPSEEHEPELDAGEPKAEAEPATPPPPSLTLHPPAWTPGDYAPGVTDSGADKLASSALAPLVAAARPYETLAPGEATAKSFCKRIGIDLRTSAGGQVKARVENYDALAMPWYRPEDVNRAQLRGEPVPVASWQLRPHPLGAKIDDKSGKPVKYEVLAGNPSVMGVHPATPRSWIAEPATVFITEGMLKADSALSALLVRLGASDELLRSQNPDDLTAFMESVPASERVLIIALVGVGNWHSNPEWDSFNLRGKPVWIAFDGDVASTLNVWTQASRIFRKLDEQKHATPMLLDLSSVTDHHGEKVGVDDFFAMGHRWEELAGLLTTTLPERPGKGEEDTVGDWRINEVECTTEEYRVPPTGGRAEWKKVCELAGRVVSFKGRRSATDKEMATGTRDEEMWKLADTDVEIEVKWVEEDNTIHSGVILGPSNMLADPPASWHKSGRIAAAIPLHPDWPPKPKWAEAVKSLRRDEIKQLAVWDHMGWVPTSNGCPVFIVGKQVIGAGGEQHGDDRLAEPGVTEEILAGADRFGVTIPKQPTEVVDAVEQMLDAYDAAWTDKRIAAIVIATALRPVVPIPCRAPLYMSGTKGSGKSWTASTIMGFWQSDSGAWSSDQLPGGAADTGYSTENALAHAPIWVSDDLAPSADRRQAEMAEAKMADIIRAVFNGSAKRRMYADGTARQLLSPRALFIATAENELSVGSVMDRVVHIRFSKSSLARRVHTNAVNRLRDETMMLPTITGFAILGITNNVAANGWQAEMERWKEIRRALITKAQDDFAEGEEKGADEDEGAGGATRSATIAADITLGLVALDEALKTIGRAEPKRVSALRKRIEPMRQAITSFIGETYSDQLLSTPGQNLLKALASLLRSGNAHLVAPGSGGLPILDSDKEVKNPRVVNQLLGWQLPSDDSSSPRPNGTAIGHIVRDRATKELYALFEQQTAFDVAKRYHPALIPPGSYPLSSWESMWAEKLAGGPWSRKQSRGTLRPVVSVMCDGTALLGIPVKLATLIAQAEAGKDDADGGGED